MEAAAPEAGFEGRQVRASLLILALVLALPQCTAQPIAQNAPWIFVQSAIEWQRSPQGYDVGGGAIVLMDSNHRFMKLVTQLYREAKDQSLSVDLKSGYLVYAGSWSSKDGGSIEVTAKVVDS